MARWSTRTTVLTATLARSLPETSARSALSRADGLMPKPGRVVGCAPWRAARPPAPACPPRPASARSRRARAPRRPAALPRRTAAPPPSGVWPPPAQAPPHGWTRPHPRRPRPRPRLALVRPGVAVGAGPRGLARARALSPAFPAGGASIGCRASGGGVEQERVHEERPQVAHVGVDARRVQALRPGQAAGYGARPDMPPACAALHARPSLPCGSTPPDPENTTHGAPGRLCPLQNSTTHQL